LVRVDLEEPLEAFGVLARTLECRNHRAQKRFDAERCSWESVRRAKVGLRERGKDEKAKER